MTGSSSTTSNAADAPEPLVALRVAAAWGHLHRCGSSTMLRHRLRRGALQLAPWRSQRDRPDFYHGLLVLLGTNTVRYRSALARRCGRCAHFYHGLLGLFLGRAPCQRRPSRHATCGPI